MKKIALLCLMLCVPLLATQPDKETRRWWSHVQALASDEMEGRDTGSGGYRKAARYVTQQFNRLGLRPAGERGYGQTVPLHAVRLRADQSQAELVRNGSPQKLQWLRQITVPANPALPDRIEAGLVFLGSADYAKDLGVKGKILVQLNPVRLVSGAPAPVVQTLPEGAVGILGIDSTEGPEPARWPVQYSVAMTIAGQPAARNENPPLVMRFNPAFAEMLFEGSGHTYKELRDLAAQGKPLPNFVLPASLRATMRFESKDLESDNLLAILPGSDPVLTNEVLVLSAHLDGYGFGEPWNSDRIYNGVFDNAAYVATLIDMAERLRDQGKKLRRSLLLAVVTGEEKGLLGSRYFTQHPTIPKERIIADINLDQLRPLFPLKTLTTLAVDDSTLGDVVKRVAEPMGIRIQPDPEPIRNLLRRSDHWAFMQIGVPAVGFIFGYEKGSPEEAVYREWYARRYHTPLDDLNQPWDPAAAAKFNDFFNRLVETVANADERPKWKPGSAIAPR